jgi:hypothetical protein
MTVQVAQQVSALPGPALLGSASVDPPAIERTEDAQISEIVERLQRRYTREQISIEDLNRRVSGCYHQFDEARIRNFVAILVESLVRRSIPSPARRPGGAMGSHANERLR